MMVSGQLHAPAALPWDKSPWYSLDRRLHGPFWAFKQILTLRDYQSSTAHSYGVTITQENLKCFHFAM